MPFTPATDGAPCTPWVVKADLPAECTTGLDDALIASACKAATKLLWAFSGRRYGKSCPITIRPGPGWCAVPPRGAAAGYTRRSARDLVVDGPLYTVDEVLIDGVALVEDTDYVVLDHRVIRLIGDTYTAWPSTQDLGLATTEVGTWSVTYTVGLVVPDDGTYAAVVLACELLKARRNGPCKLPRKTRTVARQGVTIEIGNLNEYLVNGLIGIDECDLFITTENPHALASRSTVMSPDLPRGPRVG